MASLIPIITAFSVLYFSSFTIMAASFDCQKTNTSTEKLICSDKSLSKLDDYLNTAYWQSLNRMADKTILRRLQQDWIKYVMADCSNVDCLKQALNQRIALLRDISYQDSDSARWTGKYMRYFRGKEDPDTAELILVGLTENRVYVSGNAVWIDDNPGQANTGELQGIGVIKSNKLFFADVKGEECNVNMIQKTKNTIMVNETQYGCHGLNVSFDGEYRKSSPLKSRPE